VTDYDYDVLVIGSGAAGLSAALTAGDAGASVLIAESEGTVGGSSKLSGGQIMGAGTRLQKRAGIEDSPEEFYRYYMTLNQWQLEPVLIRRFCEEAGPSIDWLEDLGVEFEPELFLCGDEPISRDHSPIGVGAGIMAVLERACRTSDRIEIALGRRIDRLLVEDGRVVGAAVGSDEVRARATVVATGGFGANPELLERYLPEAATAKDWLYYIGAPGSRGDAIGWAGQVGAQVVGRLGGQVSLVPHFDNVPEVYFPGWLVIVNQHGQRFFDEMSSYSMTQGIANSQGGPIYAVFDEPARKAATRAGASAAKKRDIPGSFYKWVDDVLDVYIKSGVVVSEPTVAALAERIGVPADGLTGTLERYNQDVRAGFDSFFGKDTAYARILDTPPFYATELRLAILGLTGHGLRIDSEARVINTRSQAIDGLYAAGECTGNVLGSIYVGSGNSYGNCVTFGRIAGRSAAEAARAAR
jgi:fumarate reductase flavoprotein subunit